MLNYVEYTTKLEPLSRFVAAPVSNVFGLFDYGESVWKYKGTP